jgi:hypothetical protein
MAFYQDRWDHTGEGEPDKEVEAVIEMPKDV